MPQLVGGDDAELFCVETRSTVAIALHCQVSGRGWKVPGTRAGARKNPGLATSWEAKMAVKAEAKLFREQKTEARDAHKAKLSARHLPRPLRRRGCSAAASRPEIKGRMFSVVEGKPNGVLRSAACVACVTRVGLGFACCTAVGSPSAGSTAAKGSGSQTIGCGMALTGAR